MAGRPERRVYRPVVEGPGEPHQHPVDVAEPIACFVHLTDLHVTDAQSPARFEFVNAMAGDRRYRELLTMQRPQEMLNNHAIAAMVRAINDLEAGPLTGARPSVVVMTGDAIDNTQHNELANFFALLDGGTVRPDSGAQGYEGVQLASWPGSLFWKPDGPADADDFQRELGFPRHPGLLDEAVRSFESPGLKIPMLRCYGNHEQECQGVGVVTPALAKAMAGSRKPVEMPAGVDPDAAVETFAREPARFMTGGSREVTPDADRRSISRREFVDPSFYVHDAGDVRFIALDTPGSRRSFARAATATSSCCRITARTLCPTHTASSVRRSSWSCCGGRAWCCGSTATSTPTGSRSAELSGRSPPARWWTGHARRA